MRRYALVALALACRPGGAPPRRDASPDARTAPPPRRGTCDELRDDGARALAAWRRRHGDALDDEGWSQLGGFTRCEADGDGVWATVLVGPPGDTPRDRVDARFRLVRVAPEGARSEAFPSLGDPGEGFTLRAGDASLHLDARTRAVMGAWRRVDFDGDGAAELVLPVTVGDATRALVWRATATRLEPYEPAMGLRPVAVDDVDGDGRVDLLTHAELRASDDAHPEREARGPTLVALSRPDGTFALSTGDALARNRARCPAAPVTFVARPPTPFDPAATARAVGCAALWGVAPALVDAALARECPAGGDRPCLAWLPALRALARVTPQADLRAAVSFRVDGDADGDAGARAVTLVLEGVAALRDAELPLGRVEGDCDVVPGDARVGEVAALRCWRGAVGDEVRVLRAGEAVSAQRRAMRESAAPGAWTVLRRWVIPATVALRAGTLE